MKKKNPLQITRSQFFAPDTPHVREMRLEINADEGSRSVELSFSSEEPVKRHDWWNDSFYSEILSHDGDAVDLGRLQAFGVALYNHHMDQVVGRLENVVLDKEKKRCTCRVVFDDDEISEWVYNKVKRGTLKGVSVGYRVYQWEEIAADGVSKEGIEGPAMIARKWEPLEVSIASCPADQSVGVGRNINYEGEDSVKFRDQVTDLLRQLGTGAIKREEFETQVRVLVDGLEAEEKPEAKRFVKEIYAALKMKRTAKDPSGDDDLGDGDEDPTEEGNDSGRGIEAERTRAAEIISACAAFGASDQAAGFIERGTPVVKVYRSLVKKQAENGGALHIGRSVTIESDARDKFRRAVVDGLRMRAGHVFNNPAPGAEEFRNLRLVNLARMVLERNGEALSYHTDEMDIVGRAFGTSDFPAIMTDLANVTLIAAYEEAPTTWRQWCRIGSASDFKAIHKTRLGEMPMLEPIVESGEYKMASLLDTKDSFAIGTFGIKFALTRQAIINDSLGAFSEIPTLFGSASARTINHAVYALLTSNPTLAEDNKTVFHADHGNYISTGTALSVATLSAARVAMRRQKGLDKKNPVTLNVIPGYLIIPPELESSARQILYSDTDVSQTNPAVKNPVKNAVEPVVESELTGWAWYLAAKANVMDTIEVAFLNGQQSPVIEQQPGWNVDGIEYKVRLDFGAWMYDYRGLYKNNGAEPSVAN